MRAFGNVPVREGDDDLDRRLRALAGLDHVVPLAARADRPAARACRAKRSGKKPMLSEWSATTRKSSGRESFDRLAAGGRDLLAAREAVGVARAEPRAEGARVHRERRCAGACRRRTGASGSCGPRRASRRASGRPWPRPPGRARPASWRGRSPTQPAASAIARMPRRNCSSLMCGLPLLVCRCASFAGVCGRRGNRSTHLRGTGAPAGNLQIIGDGGGCGPAGSHGLTISAGAGAPGRAAAPGCGAASAPRRRAARPSGPPPPPTPVEHDDARAQLHHELQVVRGDQLRERDLPQQVHELPAPLGSRLLVGSSSTRMEGSQARTPARHTRRFSPTLR